MSAVIDFHSHVLPDIDDGSASVAESVAMLQLEAEQGITHVIATPHFYPRHDTPERFLERRARAEEALRTEMANHSGLPEVGVGAEVHFFRGMSESEILPRLTIREKHCILIEMPPSPWPESAYRELEGIWEKHGITPVIAHIDRYIGPIRTYHIPERLAELPVLVQANADFFLNRSTALMALRMLKMDQIHLLGSDCHNMSSRKPNLGIALQEIRRRLGEDMLSRIREYEHGILRVKDSYIDRMEWSL